MSATSGPRSERFVAVVDITRVVTSRPAEGRSAVSRTEPAPSKETTQVKVTVRSGNLDDLKEKVHGVLALLDEDDLAADSEELGVKALVDVPDRLSCDHCGALYFPTSQAEQCPHRSIFVLRIRKAIRKAVRR